MGNLPDVRGRFQDMLSGARAEANVRKCGSPYFEVSLKIAFWVVVSL